LIPAANRFPTSADGSGFKPLAEHIHALGLKFGIHIMRGIPKLAVEKNTPILGTTFTARDIYSTRNGSSWLRDMYTVDASKPGAQDARKNAVRISSMLLSVFCICANHGLRFGPLVSHSSIRRAASWSICRCAKRSSGRSQATPANCGAASSSTGRPTYASSFAHTTLCSKPVWLQNVSDRMRPWKDSSHFNRTALSAHCEFVWSGGDAPNVKPKR